MTYPFRYTSRRRGSYNRASESSESSDDNEKKEKDTTSISSESLASIASILKRLQDHEAEGKVCLDVQDEWLRNNFFVSPVRLAYDPTDSLRNAPRVAAMSEMLISLKDASDALCKLSNAIRREVMECNYHLKSLRNRGGISSLPDEILTMILEYAATSPKRRGVYPWSGITNRDLETNTAMMRLSHVCRRFMILSAPYSRSFIAPSMDLDLVSARIQSPSLQPIHILIEDGYEGPKEKILEPFLQKAAVHSTKWRRFYLSDRKRRVRKSDSLAVLAHETLNIHVPDLSFLLIECCDMDVPGTYWYDPKNPIHFYSSWNAPNLRTFIVDSIIPTPFVTSTSLTCFEFKFRFYEHSAKELIALIEFIASCFGLETLSLEMTCLTKIMIHPSSWNGKDLDRLKTFKLTLGYWYKDSLGSFLDTIRFPNVSMFSAHFKEGENAQVAIVCDFAQKLRNLHRFDLRAGRSDEHPVDIVLADFPTLRHLSVDISFQHFKIEVDSTSSIGARLPVLETLEFIHCRLLKRSWVFALLHDLKSKGITPLVTMQDCRWRRERKNHSKINESAATDSTDSESDSDSESESDSDDYDDEASQTDFCTVSAVDVLEMLS